MTEAEQITSLQLAIQVLIDQRNTLANQVVDLQVTLTLAQRKMAELPPKIAEEAKAE